MPDANNTTSDSDKNLSIEKLISTSINRTKERFLPYLLAAVISVAIVVVAFLTMGLLGGAVFLLWIGTKSGVIAGIFGGLALIASIAAFIYIQSWINLTVIYTIIAEPKVSVTDAFKKMRPLVLGYVWVSIVNFLLLFGLLPFGILTLFILFLIWVIWSMFTVYVYIEHKMRGLDNIFMSKAIISNWFWGFVFRIAIIYALYFFIIFIIQAIGRESQALQGIIYMIFSFFAGPFMISYLYEIYHNLKYPKDVGSKQIWIILSAIGWGIMILAVFSLSSLIGRELPKIQEQFMKQDKKNEKMYPFPSEIYDDYGNDADIEETSPSMI